MLNNHLWGKFESPPPLEDYFVSWTSSLLVAIHHVYYIYHQSISRRVNLQIGSMKIFVIDTRYFPDGAFLSDLDLIRHFESDIYQPEQDLKQLSEIRHGTGHYFGEYLSQGSLKIEGICGVISADTLFESRRLQRIQECFFELEDHLDNMEGFPTHSNIVVDLRKDIWRSPAEEMLSSEAMTDRLELVKEISRTDWFTEKGIETFTQQNWQVTAESSRVGVRLSGFSPIERCNGHGELASEGTMTGAIQVPHTGQPVLFLADRPLTGGYPVIGNVAEHHLDLLGRLPINSRVRFCPISPFEEIQVHPM